MSPTTNATSRLIHGTPLRLVRARDSGAFSLRAMA